MINKSLKKNAYISIFLFFCTMLPIGVYSTAFGSITLVNLLFLLKLTIIYFMFIFLLYYIFVLSSYFKNIIFNKNYFKVKLFFFNSEIIFRICVFLLPFFICLITGKLFWNNLPIIVDSVAQYAHSKIISTGKFSVKIPPFVEFFPMDGIITKDNNWYSQYQLGNMLLLAIGHFFYVPYLVFPLITGFSSLILYSLSYDNYDIKTARLTGILSILCTQWWYMGSEYMSHNTSLFGCLLFIWSWLRLQKLKEWKYSFISGIALGLALITRPISVVPVVLPFLIFGGLQFLKMPLKKLLLVIPMVLMICLFIVWQLYFNYKTTGSWLVFAQANSFLYGFDKINMDNFVNYNIRAHTPWRGFGNLSNNLIGLNIYLFNWPVPSMIFAILGVGIFKISSITKIMISSCVLLAIVYIPYYFQDWCFGPRFMYESTGFLIIFTALGIVKITAILRIMSNKNSRLEAKLTVKIFFIFLVIGGVCLFFSGVQKADTTYNAIKNNYTVEADKKFPDNSLVFTNHHYDKFLIYQPPLDSNRVIYAKDLGDNNQKLIDYYPNRTVFLETGDGVFTKIRDAKK